MHRTPMVTPHRSPRCSSRSRTSSRERARTRRPMADNTTRRTGAERIRCPAVHHARCRGPGTPRINATVPVQRLCIAISSPLDESAVYVHRDAQGRPVCATRTRGSIDALIKRQGAGPRQMPRPHASLVVRRSERRCQTGLGTWSEGLRERVCPRRAPAIRSRRPPGPR